MKQLKIKSLGPTASELSLYGANDTILWSETFLSRDLYAKKDEIKAKVSKIISQKDN